jgi:hypothetical protein
VFLTIAHAPRRIVETKMLPAVRGQLALLKEKEAAADTTQGYYDDYCLTRFLEGVCLRYVAFPVRTFYLFSAMHLFMERRSYRIRTPC